MYSDTETSTIDILTMEMPYVNICIIPVAMGSKMYSTSEIYMSRLNDLR